MSKNESSSKRSDGSSESADKAYMRHCGTHKMNARESNSDGLRGDIPLTSNDLQAVGASANDKIRGLVEANGRSVTAVREVHADGQSISLPTKYRQRLDLSPGDEIEYWIDLVETQDSSNNKSQQRLTDDSSKKMTKLAVKFPGQDTYHHIESQNAEETVCGIDLTDRDYRKGEEPSGGLLELCKNCAVRSSADMSNEEIVDWLSEEIGFEKEGGPPSYFNKKQLVALRDFVLEQEEEIDRLRDEIQELREKVEAHQVEDS